MSSSASPLPLKKHNPNPKTCGSVTPPRDIHLQNGQKKLNEINSVISILL
jgi:hypothetical protein